MKCRGYAKFNVPDNKELCPDSEESGSIPAKEAGLPITLDCKKCESSGNIERMNQNMFLFIFLIYLVIIYAINEYY